MNANRQIVFWNIVIYIAILLTCVYYFGNIIYLQYFASFKENGKDVRYRDVQPPVVMKDMLNRANILSYDHKFLSVYVPEYSVGLDYWAGSIRKDRLNRDALLVKEFKGVAEMLSKYGKLYTSQKYYAEMVRYRALAEEKAQKNEIKSYNKYFEGTIDITVYDSIMAFVGNRKLRNRARFALITDEKGRREYPYGNLAHRTIYGIEKSTEGYLKTFSGSPDIVTSIDTEIQDIADMELRKKLSNNLFEAGVIIVMEVSTGDIKAMVNLSRSQKTYDERLLYSITETTDPGSTFKIASLMAALETGKIDIDTNIDCDSDCDYPAARNGNKRKRWHGVFENKNENYGMLPVQRIIERSLNIGTAKTIHLAFKGRGAEFVESLRKLHITDTIDLGLPDRNLPFLKNPHTKRGPRSDGWNNNSMYQISVGYEVNIAPLNTLCFYNAIANKGIMVKPRLVRGIRHNTGVEEISAPEIITARLCSQATLEKVRKVLSGVVGAGTASAIAGTKYGIAGKTGTAQRYMGGAYSRGGYHQASFCGYFPEKNPKYSCIVVLYSDSDKATSGGEWAAPLFKNVADKIYTMHPELRTTYEPVPNTLPDMPRIRDTRAKNLSILANQMKLHVTGKKDSEEWISVKDSAGIVVLSEINHDRKLMPELSNMGLRDAVYMLEKSGIKVKINGFGAEIQQSLEAGTPVGKNEILLKLN